MALDADDEILQDFLVEAAEILEQLNEQLVDLEQRPTDSDLLNTVFRGFHTIKGGAGFLSLDALVNVCHRSEDIFNLLRNGEKSVTPELMDTMLEVLDVLNAQFASLQAMEEPEGASAALLQRLEAMNCPDGAVVAAAVETPPVESKAATPATGDITDEEFETLLDTLDNRSAIASAAATPVATPAAASSSENITEDEFDALLDELHGKGKFDPNKLSSTPTSPPPGDVTNTPPVVAPVAASGSENITEEEFEALLDQLHGKGKFDVAKVSEVGTDQQQPAAASPPAVPPATKPSPVPSSTAPTLAKKETAPQAETTVRVDTRRLDDIMNMVGELVLVRNRLATLASGGERHVDPEEMSKAVANLDVVTGDLQTSVMKTRMQPIKKVFGRFPRVVRDLARSLKKDVNLVLEGEETDLDKNLVEALADPLVHLIRNSVDHGIESPADREAAGKPRQGIVRLSAAQEGDHILLSIEDDGAGMDADKLRKLAVKKGMMDADAAARLDDKEAFMLIMAAGFSTKTEISDVSGRGVGMDVVKTRIGQLNGSIEIDSELGRGTLLSIKVPLTLAIMPTLMIKLSEQNFALPLASVSEIFNLDLTESNTVDGQLVVMIRGHALPLFYLGRWLVKGQENIGLPESGHVVVVNVGTQQVGYLVDQLVGQEEVVIKPLGAMLHGTSGMAGATITGDGKIALILDVPSLMKAYA